MEGGEKKSQLNTHFLRLIKEAGSVQNETLTETAGVPGCAERAALSCKLILTLKSLPQKLLRQSSCCIPNAASAAFFFSLPSPPSTPCPLPPPLFFFSSRAVWKGRRCASASFAFRTGRTIQGLTGGSSLRLRCL